MNDTLPQAGLATTVDSISTDIEDLGSVIFKIKNKVIDSELENRKDQNAMPSSAHVLQNTRQAIKFLTEECNQILDALSLL